MVRLSSAVVLACAALAACPSVAPPPADGGDDVPPRPSGWLETAIVVDTSAVVATVDERYLGYAIDTTQIVGGNWWADNGDVALTDPYDFSRDALHALVANGLEGSMLRIGGSEADRVFYDMGDVPLADAPGHYEFVFTRAMFDAMCGFADDHDLTLLFTLNAGPGPRDDNLRWTSDNARVLFDAINDTGCPVEVIEFGNEVNGYRAIHGADYALTGAEYAEDLAVARALVDELLPGVRLAGPSSAYWPVWGELAPIMPTFMPEGGHLLDIVTWHYYPQQSHRCPVQVVPTTPTTLQDTAALDEIHTWADEVEALTVEHAPDAEVWLGETGHAQCGGEPGVSGTFVSALWWMDEVGLVARRGQPRIVRQTLSGADYQMIDDVTLQPLPDYFASVAHRALMGQQVFDAHLDDDNAPWIRSYAHCAQDGDGVMVLLVNPDRFDDTVVTVAADGVARDVWLFESGGDDVLATSVTVNGVPWTDGALPAAQHFPVDGDAWVALPKESFAFVHIPDATGACTP